MKQKMVAMSVFAILLLSSVIAVSEPATESDENGTSQTLQSIVKIWEAYAKGWVEITSENVSYYGYPSPLVFRVNNTRDVNVNINEMVVLMSPHPLQTGDPQTTQDGALTNAVVAPNSVVNFYYGEMTLPGEYFAGEKPWWCTEARQVTQDGATLVLGGEIMPIPLQELVKNPDQYTNSRIWSYLYQNPMLVVGKTPLWKEIPDATNVYVDTTIAVTNLAVYNGSLVPDPPHARNSVIEDILPKDYSYDPVSFDPAPDTIISNPDGTKTIRWSVDVDAADVGTHLYLDPTPYHTVFLNYTLITPKLSVGRYFLERAWADVDHDGTNDSYSARPLLEVFWVNKPPIPNAGGPYIASEGEIVHFDASGTYDADGDPLQYMWDIDGDGIFETNYSSSPLFDFTLGDDFIGMARLRVTDGTHEVETVASLTINNVAPTIEGIDWSA
ncbi:MAG: PKD domain-containing protein, partial [Thermoplasmata archaeon]